MQAELAGFIVIVRRTTLRFALGAGYNYDTTSIRPSFDSHSTAVRPRYDHSSTTRNVPTQLEQNYTNRPIIRWPVCLFRPQCINNPEQQVGPNAVELQSNESQTTVNSQSNRSCNQRLRWILMSDYGTIRIVLFKLDWDISHSRCGVGAGGVVGGATVVNVSWLLAVLANASDDAKCNEVWHNCTRNTKYVTFNELQ